MGLPTAIVANMTSEQLEAYTLHLRIEEISQKLKIDDVVPADGDRYDSPAYNIEIIADKSCSQISLSCTTVRQPRSTCEYSRVPIPKAPRGRAPQTDRKGDEDHS